MNNQEIVKTDKKELTMREKLVNQATAFKFANAEKNALEFASAFALLKNNEKYSIKEVFGAFLTVARKDLSHDNRDYYLIDYQGLTVQIGYMGQVKLAKRAGVMIKDPIPVYKASLDNGFINLDNNVFSYKLMQEKLFEYDNPTLYKVDLTENFGKNLVGFIVPMAFGGETLYEFVLASEIYQIYLNYSQKSSPAWKLSLLSMLKTKAVKLAIRKHQIEIANATGNDLQGEIQKIEGSHIQIADTDKTQQVTMLSENEQSVIIDTEHQDVQTQASVDDAESNFLSDEPKKDDKPTTDGSQISLDDIM